MTEEVTSPSQEAAHAAPRARVIADRVRSRAEGMWDSAAIAMRKPAIGAGLAGATVLAAGAWLGVTEAALAGVAAWAVFRLLKKRTETVPAH